MSKLAVAAAFFMGAAGGSLATWKFLKEHYAKRSQEEIDSAKHTFFKLLEEERAKHISKEDSEDATEEPAEQNVEKIRPIIQDRYISGSMKQTTETSYDSIYKNIRETAKEIDKPDISYRSEKFIPGEHPYVIDPHDLGEFDDYTVIVLTMYEDEIVADENDEIVEDTDRIIGEEALDILKKGVETSVYVRNDQLKCDYEISLDARSYFKDILPEKPSSYRESL